ncbi:MAG: adenine deaminase [Ferruginibacter sp.]
MNSFTLTGNIVDILNRQIFYGEIKIVDGKISSILRSGELQKDQNYILPGFIDSHVHIESSMLIPSEFARLAVVHGTVGTISDPHEIANVCGIEGVQFMIDNGKTVPFKFNFGAPSCVPATIFETAGAALNAGQVEQLLKLPEIKYLSEMMNFPGVLHNDSEVMKKIAAAKKYDKPVDGHAPGLRGELAKKYIDAGISTDHECFTEEEALDKLGYGMKILIREGSAAKNFDALIGLMNDHSDNMMFCSDDKHPDSLADGHIDQLCARAVAEGIDVFKVLKAACLNPVLHYKMDVGLLQEQDPADMIVINDLVTFKVIQTYVDGNLVAENGESKIKSVLSVPINQFECDQKQLEDLIIPFNNENQINVIEALDGQLITNRILVVPLVKNEQIVSDPTRDILKIVVVNRYKNAPVSKGFIKNFGITQGAIASSVAHDSHNIVAIGVDDVSLLKAINLVIIARGGVSAVSATAEKVLALPVAGLMSAADGYQVANAYTEIDKMVKQQMGSTLTAPFMTLSFMALLVIPHLKLSDMGMFDGDEFQFV